MPVNKDPGETASGQARWLCWSCREEPGDGPFCGHCVKIQPVEYLGSYFTLFGLYESYAIDSAVLKKRFYELSRKFHPDFYSGQSSREQRLARNNTAYLNTALKVLLDPIRRADYLLSLHFGTHSGRPAPPQELFEEILEIGEILEREPLSDDERARLKTARTGFENRCQELLVSLKDLFATLENGGGDVRAEIESRLNNVKYLRTILARIDTALAAGRHKYGS